jgi:phospho-N-acetylmuramoyl-pentapeptide-transferase
VIYELLYPLSRSVSWLNVLRYVPFRIILSMISALLMSFLLAPWFIRHLQSKQIGQVIRQDGPATHQLKAGTPTMGGSLILLCTLLPTVLWADVHNALVMATAGVTAGYGLIGFLDDRLKLEARNSRGLPGKYKIVGQVSIGGAGLLYSFVDFGQLPADWLAIRTRLSLPFVAFSKFPVELPLWFYLGFALFVLVAFSNGVNLTDGLDGLAIGPVMINAGTYLIWAYVAGSVFFGQPLAAYLDIPGIVAMGELSVFAAALIGAGVGFLWYNTYPAQVFMGDVGSLALGGGVGMLAILTKNELLSVLVGGVFVVESVSVVAQVTSYKLWRKRIFLMAPIHHHFEKKGWPEPKIIVRFWIISVLLALIGLSSLKLR